MEGSSSGLTDIDNSQPSMPMKNFKEREEGKEEMKKRIKKTGNERTKKGTGNSRQIDTV